MRAHYLQHVPFEGLGSIEAWLRAAGYRISGSRLYQGERLPRPEDVDFLVVMGGPMSANDEAALPWLAPEKRFIRRVVDASKPVLGVCLGAQLIASAMGERVFGNPQKEIGWFPIRGVELPDGFPLRFPPSLDVFHWHGETFDLPAGAIRLARSEGCENQAFLLGTSVLGLQFHLEMTPESVRQIVTHCRAELQPSRYVQSEARILAAPGRKYRRTNDLMNDVLAFLTAARA